MNSPILIYWKRLFFLISCAIMSSFPLKKVHAQSLNPNWRQDLTKEMHQFQKCEHTFVNGTNTCNRFLGESLTVVYGITDFYLPQKKRHMRVSEIVDFLGSSENWELLGKAYEPEALKKSQEYANTGKAAVAVYMNPKMKIGNISLILPGELKSSGSWGFLKVPNSSSFILSDPAKSYIDKSLSYGYRKGAIKYILLYGRKTIQH